MTTDVRTTEAAFLLNISTGRLRILLQQNRVVGAYKVERFWMIPLNNRGVPEITPGRRGPQGTWNKAQRTGNTFIHVLRNTKKVREFGSPVTLVRGGKTNGGFNRRDEGR